MEGLGQKEMRVASVFQPILWLLCGGSAVGSERELWEASEEQVGVMAAGTTVGRRGGTAAGSGTAL